MENELRKDYFSGAPPFTSPKQRTDIPDSFIWQTISDLTQEHEMICVVSNDGALYKAAAEKTGIKAYRQLDDFIESDECQSELRSIEADTVVQNLVRASSFLRNQKSVLIARSESDLVRALLAKPVMSNRIRKSDHTGVIISVGKWKTLDFEFDGVDFYGESEIGIPFWTRFDCQVNYRMEIQDFLAMRVNDLKEMSVTERDSYYDINETFKLNLEATLTVKFPAKEMKDENLSDALLLGLLREATSEVEVKELTVLDGSGFKTPRIRV
jgi:hypothetical protein